MSSVWGVRVGKASGPSKWVCPRGNLLLGREKWVKGVHVCRLPTHNYQAVKVGATPGQRCRQCNWVKNRTLRTITIQETAAEKCLLKKAR